MHVRMTPTGFASAECSLAVTAEGALVIGPAFTRDGVGVIVSADGGATWEPRVPPGRTHRRIQPFTFVDPTTGRLFFKTARFDVMPPRPFATGYDLSTSDDLGITWRGTHTVAPRMRDWSKLIAGPAPSGDPDQRRITYLTGPVPFSTRIWPLVPQRYQGVERSRDGGDTWAPAPRGARLTIDPRRDPAVPRWDHINYGNGFVDPGGRLWLAGRRGRQLGVAMSADGGASWTVRSVPGSELRAYRNPLHYVIRYSNYLLPESIARSPSGTLLAVWPDARDVLRGAWSRDDGATWSEPVALGAAGVSEVRYTSVCPHPGGGDRFGLAYYGRDRSLGRGFTAYLSEVTLRSDDAQLAGGPITPGDAPLFPRGFDPGYLRIMLGGDLNEMLQARYAADGTLYLACAMEMTGANRRHTLHPASRRRRLQAVLGTLSPGDGAPDAEGRA